MLSTISVYVLVTALLEAVFFLILAIFGTRSLKSLDLVKLLRTLTSNITTVLNRTSSWFVFLDDVAVIAHPASRPPYATTAPRITLMDLHDDVLHEIMRAVVTLAVSTKRHRRRSRRDRNGNGQFQNPLHSFSMANRRLRHLAAPYLFRSIQVGHDWTWYKGLKAVHAVAAHPAAHRYARRFAIDLYVGPDGTGPPPPEHLPARFADALRSLTHLRTATLVLPAHHTGPFRAAFFAAKEPVMLPSVKTLILGPHMDWIVPACPNLEVLSTHDWRWLHSDVDGDYSRRHSFELIAAARAARHLRHFEMVAWWDLALLGAVVAALPHLPSLAMTGGTYYDRLEILLPLLAELRELDTLALAGVSALGVGFVPRHLSPAAAVAAAAAAAPMAAGILGGGGGGGGTARHDPIAQNQRNRRLEQMREARANKAAARMVFRECASVQRVWIGDQQCATRIVRPGQSEEDVEFATASRSGPTMRCCGG